jgi:stage II sporulation protein AA (anti-sigma F factor antagonist)
VPLSHEVVDNVSLIALAGQINGSNALDLEKDLFAFTEQSYKIALDFSQVDYISSAGLRVVLLLAKHLTAHAGTLVLFSLQPSVFAIFEMCGFVDILTIVDTRRAALEKFR